LSPSWRASTASSPRAVLLTDIAQTSIKTREKGHASQRRLIRALLLIEGLDEAAVPRARSIICARRSLPRIMRDRHLPLYRLAFSLPKRLLPG
jgi:hypothetical protein